MLKYHTQIYGAYERFLINQANVFLAWRSVARHSASFSLPFHSVPSRPVLSCRVVSCRVPSCSMCSVWRSSLLRPPASVLRYSYPPSSPTSRPPSLSHDEAKVVVERRRGTVGPGERLPVLLKFFALKPAASRLTVSAVRWTVFHWNENGSGVGIGDTGEGTVGTCPRVSVLHRLEGRGKLLHGTLEQRAAR